MTHQEICLADKKDCESQVAELLKSKPKVIGLCGGGSILPILQALVSLCTQKNSSRDIIEKTSFILVDERMLPLDHDESNAKLINENLVLAAKQHGVEINFTPFNTLEPEEGKSQYENILNKDSLDLVFLGMGPDSHIASIFPHGAWVKNQNLGTLFFEKNSPKPPPHRMSLSPETIVNARNITLLFFGEAKAMPYKIFKENSKTTDEAPILITKDHSSLMILVDQSCLDAYKKLL